MPRKTLAHLPLAQGLDPGFNEAAARCRGKRGRSARRGVGARASMRPRPDAAENDREPVADTLAVFPASMRPRPDAAENSHFCRLTLPE